MEVSTGALSGALRVGLQVVSNRRRPAVEIYQEFRRIGRPEEEYKIEGRFGTADNVVKVRGADVVFPFYAVNTGGVRAEAIELSLEGDLERPPRRPLSQRPLFNRKPIPQLAPAEAFLLFVIEEDHLYIRGPDGKVSGIKPGFTIVVRYDGPRRWYNGLMYTVLGWLKKKRYRAEYRFDPELLQGADYPPTEYA